MLTVYCVRWGDKYPRHFVEDLKDSIANNLSVPHKFVCYTDNPEFEYDRPVKYPFLRGVWHKLALLENTGDSLFFDLDIKINSNIDFLCKDFNNFSNNITSWLENIDNSAIVLYNGKYEQVQPANN